MVTRLDTVIMWVWRQFCCHWFSRESCSNAPQSTTTPILLPKFTLDPNRTNLALLRTVASQDVNRNIQLSDGHFPAFGGCLINPGNVLKTREAGGNPNICFNEIEIFVPSGLFVSCSLLRGVDTWHPVNPGRKRRVAIKQQFLLGLVALYPRGGQWTGQRGFHSYFWGRQRCRLSICSHFGWVWQIHYQRRKVQVTTQTRSLVFLGVFSVLSKTYPVEKVKHRSWAKFICLPCLNCQKSKTQNRSPCLKIYFHGKLSEGGVCGRRLYKKGGKIGRGGEWGGTLITVTPDRAGHHLPLYLCLYFSLM